MLSLVNVEVVYSRVVSVLRGVSLKVQPGQMVALLGGNGAGKTTTLKAISGLLAAERGQITHGRIEFNGNLLNGLSPEDVVHRGVIQVMEGRPLFRHLEVEENLVLGHLGFRGSANLREDLEKVYHYFPPLKALRRNQAGFLSGGEQQMLVIGRALIGHPQIMLLDEPSLGLAPMLVSEIFGIIEQLCRQEGVSILVVEQNARVALNTVDYGYVMEGGRIVLEGSAAALRDNETIRESYLGVGESGHRRSYRDIKQYKKRKQWYA